MAAAFVDQAREIAALFMPKQILGFVISGTGIFDFLNQHPPHSL